MTTDTIFDLASLTKPIVTSTLVMRLIDEGKLSADDPVYKHLPEFATDDDEKRHITVGQLLLHTSGLIADNAMSDYHDGPERARERLLALRPTTSPGTRFVYSDVGFMVLGLLVERIEKRSLDVVAPNASSRRSACTRPVTRQATISVRGSPRPNAATTHG
ncbi:MAG: serine hydrolase domain-containing protein [Pirellulales bacterium]